MPKARFFISSTFYDLRPVRSEIMSFLRGLGCEPVMFEAPDFAPNPMTWAPNAAIERVEDCQAMVLLVGSSFGSEHLTSRKSITNEEYIKARSENLPIFVFVKEDVWTVYNSVYKTNRKASVDYSKTVNDQRLFEFISEIESDRVWIEAFSTGADIIEKLRYRLNHCIYGFLELLKQGQVGWNVKQGIKSEGQKQLDMLNNTVLGMAEGAEKIVADDLERVRQKIVTLQGFGLNDQFSGKAKQILQEALERQRSFAEVDIERDTGDESESKDEGMWKAIKTFALMEASWAGKTLVEIYSIALDLISEYESGRVKLPLQEVYTQLVRILSQDT